ncbi:hypothetical protein B9Z55_019757 [Caenorhabditis nigoni]|nr:hypothetical protein B9Z55_019757 [Caenorhabditis nigoni]
MPKNEEAKSEEKIEKRGCVGVGDEAYGRDGYDDVTKKREEVETTKRGKNHTEENGGKGYFEEGETRQLSVTKNEEKKVQVWRREWAGPSLKSELGGYDKIS